MSEADETPRNLAITFRAEDFPRDEQPSAKRAAAVAERVATEELTRRGYDFFSINKLNDGALLIVYEPYPLVGNLRAIPSGDPTNRDITFSGDAQRRENWHDTYRLTPGWSMIQADVD